MDRQAGRVVIVTPMTALSIGRVWVDHSLKPIRPGSRLENIYFDAVRDYGGDATGHAEHVNLSADTSAPPDRTVFIA